MSFLRDVAATVGELWGFLRIRKKYWLVPTMVMALVLGGLVVLSQSSAVAPLVYTLF